MKFWFILLIFFSKLALASLNSQTFDISYYETSNHTLTIQEIQKKSFTKLSQHSLSKGFNFNSFWIKITFKKLDSDKVFYLSNPTIDFIDFYKDDKLIKSTGDHRTKDNNSDIGFSFLIKKGFTATYYLRLQTKNGLFNTFSLNSLTKHTTVSDLEKMFLTFFFGFILSLIIYNTFLFITLREKAYFYYISFQISIFMLLLSYSGMGYYLLWQDNHVLNELIYQKFEVIALFFALIFAQTFLGIKENSLALNRAINIILLLLIYILLTPWEYHSFLFQIVLIQTVLLGFVMIFYSIHKKVKDAKIFFMATVFILFGTLVTFLKIFGYLEVNFITTWSVYIGSMVEAILFSIALANKINALKKREQDLIHQQKENLEKEVHRQTISLQEMVKDKEVLLKEVNHRVKNNLQIISSFISFASVANKEGEVLKTLNQRIQAISLLYSSLYKPDSSTTVNMETYIAELCDDIFKIYTPDVKLNLKISNVELNFDRAITVGLLVNEIVTNTITHAFEGIEFATIKLSLTKQEEAYILLVQDNGVGFDSEKNYAGLGLKLIKRLTEKQLKGQLLLESNYKGSSFTITFV